MSGVDAIVQGLVCMVDSNGCAVIFGNPFFPVAFWEAKRIEASQSYDI